MKHFNKKYILKFIVLRFSLVVAIFLFAIRISFAQLDNTYLQDKISINQSDSAKIGLNINVFNYMRNTEYFNNIEKGRTLFGYQLNPKIFYSPNRYIKIETGLFLRNDFGGPNPYTYATPTLTIKTEYRNLSMLFGTLEGALSHRIIEPMFDISAAIEKRIENGFQLKYENSKTFFDTWINWEKFIERNSPFKEEFTVGLNLQKVVLYKNKTIQIENSNTNSSNAETKNSFSFSPIIQVMAKHRGGQIDLDTTNKFYVKINSAIGFRLSKKFNISNTNHKGFIKELRIEPYYLLYKENSNSGMPFTDGNAYYLNALIKTNHFGLMLSYWLAKNFIAPNGTSIYQIQSADNPIYFSSEGKRELLFFRLLYEKPLFNKLFMTARFEPFYDFKSSQIDFSYSFYLSYNMDFKLSKN